MDLLSLLDQLKKLEHSKKEHLFHVHHDDCWWWPMYKEVLYNIQQVVKEHPELHTKQVKMWLYELHKIQHRQFRNEATDIFAEFKAIRYQEAIAQAMKLYFRKHKNDK